MAGDGRRRRALRGRCISVGVGRHATGRRGPRRRDGVCWGHADDGDARGGGSAAQLRAGARAARRQRRGPDVAVHTREPSARDGRRPLCSTCSPPRRTSCSRFMGTRARCTTQCMAGRTRTLPRPWVQRGGHHDDAVRHGRAQRDQPIPPVSRGSAPSTAPADGCRVSRRALQRDAQEAPAYIEQHFQDMPEVLEWQWGGA